MIAFYNEELRRFNSAHEGLDKRAREAALEGFLDTNPAKISWTRGLKQELAKDRPHSYQPECIVPSLYRPYTKQWLYFNRTFNEMVLQMPRIFPDATAENRVICVAGVGAKFSFCTLITDTLPNLGMVDIGVTQCFPLYLYDDVAEAAASAQGEMFAGEANTNAKRARRDGLTDEGLAHFRNAYPHEAMTKEDVFYYVYGLLHSTEYRLRYADNLSKELPRIPCVGSAADFWAFSKAGRKLAELHISYESVQPFPVKTESPGKLTELDYRVEKMRYGKKGKEKDLTTLHYNDKITVTGIPLEAYEYVVNGKPALDWVVERQCIKTDRDSGIANDANDWAIETRKNPKYPLELIQRVITVSLETLKIVRSLPPLDVLH